MRATCAARRDDAARCVRREQPSVAVRQAFLAYTPYHLLLAETLSRQLGLEPTLLLADESGLVGRVPDLVAQGPFPRVVGLDTIRAQVGGGGRASGPARAAVYRRNVRRLRRAAREEPWERVFVPNPVRPESRVAAALAGGRASYVEDGLEAYIRSRPWSRATRFVRAASSLLAGVKPLPETDFVLSMPFDDGYALLPTHLHLAPGRTPPPIRPVQREAMRAVLSRWVAACGADPAPSYAALVLLDLATVSARVRATVQDAARQAGCAVDEVLVKPHPLDAGAEERLRADGVVVADRFLPSEVLLPRLRPGGRVFGGASSALLTTAFLRPDLHIELGPTPRQTELTTLLRAFGAGG